MPSILIRAYAVNDRDKEPRLVFVIEDLRLAHAEDQIAEVEFVAVRIQIAVVGIFAAHTVLVDAKVAVEADDRELADVKFK